MNDESILRALDFLDQVGKGFGIVVGGIIMPRVKVAVRPVFHGKVVCPASPQMR